MTMTIVVLAPPTPEQAAVYALLDSLWREQRERPSVLLTPEGQPSAAVTGPEQLLGRAREVATR